MRQTIAGAFILLGSAWLRFSHLGTQGLYTWDEMYLALHARMFADFLRAVPAGGPAMYALVARTGGLWHITAAKPSHYAMMTAAALVAGDGDLPLQAVSALFGIATVALAYAWGRRWSGTAGLCAAALLGGLGGHVWYSRNLLAAAPASFLLFLGAFLYLRDERPAPGAVLAAGVCLGLGISVHYNVLPSAALILLYAAARRDARNAGLLFVGILLPLLTWQTLFLLRNAWSARPMLDYAGELRRYLFETSRRDPAQPWVPGLMLRWLLLSSGPAAAAALAAGTCAFAAGERHKPVKPSPALLITALGPGMFLVWSVASLWWAQVARPIANLLPFLCLCAGIGWVRIADALESRGAATGLLPLVLFAAGLPWAAEFRLSESPYKKVGYFLDGNPGPVAAWNPLVQYYAPALPFRIGATERSGTRYLVADFRTPADFGSSASPVFSAPFSRFDPRLVCLEDTVLPVDCIRGVLPFQREVAVFPGLAGSK